MIALIGCKQEVTSKSGFLSAAKTTYGSGKSYIDGQFKGEWKDKNGLYPVTFDIFSSGGKNGNGMMILEKDKQTTITGQIHINGRENTFNGSFNPSKEVRLLNEIGLSDQIDIYTCHWNLVGTRSVTDNEIILKGKAVPQSCIDYAIAEFTISKKKNI